MRFRWGLGTMELLRTAQLSRMWNVSLQPAAYGGGVGGQKKPGSTGKHKSAVKVVPKPAGTDHKAPAAKGRNEVSKITVVYGSKTSKGTLFAQGSDGSTKLKADVVVGGDGHVTPTGTFHASGWEKDHVSKKYGSYADAPWSKSPLGINAF